MVKKVVLIVLGALLLIGGLLAAVVGGGLVAAFGTDGEIRSSTHPLGTSTTALISESAEFSGLSDAESWVDRPTIMLDARSQQEIFVGVGRAADVDAYLAGAPVAEVNNLNFAPYRIDVVEIPGEVTPAAPGEQTFWVARESGTDVSLRWDIQDGDYRIVLMNADGSAGVDTDARLGIQVPFLGPLSMGFLVAGVLFAIVGIVLLIIGLLTRPAPREATPVSS
jgi:hypothetical protein